MGRHSDIAVLFFCFASTLCCAAEARVQVVVVEPGGKAGSKVTDFSKAAKPGPGKELKVIVTPDAKCIVSVAAFNKDGQLVYGAPETAQGSDLTLELPAHRKWTWEGAEGVTEIDVIFAYPEAADFQAFDALVKKMNGASEEVRSMQAGAVRRWIESKLKSAATAADYSVKDAPTAVGGVMRGNNIERGQKVSIPEKQTTVLRIRVGS